MYVVVVGIDFGTSRSGYAYAFTADQRVIGRTEWQDHPTPYPKTLTQLLYGPNRKVVAWGFEARKKYYELRDEDYVFVRDFKMSLRNPEGIASKEPMMTIGKGIVVPVIGLIADYLRELKNLALEELSQNTAGQLTNKQIYWSLTVPAMWEDREKDFMRRAAREAGLIEEGEDDRLLLVPEPEAAAVRCMKDAAIQIEDGSICMVIDSGGGTVDVSVLEKQDEILKEVALGNGEALGSIYVDLEFQKHLRECLDRQAIQRFAHENRVDYIRLTEDWERAKTGFDPDRGERVCIPLPPKLYKLLSTDYPEVLERLAKEQGDDTHVHIDNKGMESLFQPVINGILKLIQTEFERLPDQRCDYLFLVGGFSTSPLLQKRIRRAFEKKVRGIVVPSTPGSTIVEGAVLFGLRPEVVTSRVCRKTYGIGTNSRFEEGLDPEPKKFVHRETGEVYCKHRFKVYAKRGKRIGFNESFASCFKPMYRDQTSIKFAVYAADGDDPRHIDELAVERIGTVILPLLPGRRREQRIECTLFFGRTEILVEAKHLENGHHVDAFLDYT